MTDLSPNVSLAVLNTNGLNTSIKKQRLGGWIKKNKPTICHLQEIHFKYNKISSIKVNNAKYIP